MCSVCVCVCVVIIETVLVNIAPEQMHLQVILRSTRTHQISIRLRATNGSISLTKLNSLISWGKNDSVRYSILCEFKILTNVMGIASQSAFNASLYGHSNLRVAHTVYYRRIETCCLCTVITFLLIINPYSHIQWRNNLIRLKQHREEKTNQYQFRCKPHAQ